ncbi:hypothetical protein QBC39DRAFT_261243 [Podospora conica]|nr:hypothetical protein QBC39DRAFT_261243 [Schizothecium conicum]
MTVDVLGDLLAALAPESSFSRAPTDSTSNIASSTSTPPTSASPDSIWLASDPDLPKQDDIAVPILEAAASLLANSTKDDPPSDGPASGEQTPVGQAIVVADKPPPTEPSSNGRVRRARASLPVYNLSKLSSASTHSKKRDATGEKRRRTISGDTLVDPERDGASESTGPNATAQDGSDAARQSKKTKHNPAPAEVTRRATRLSGLPVEDLASKLAALSKRGKRNAEKKLSNVSRELLRLRDTNEFAHIETRPVLYTVWRNGKYVDPNEEAAEVEPPRKKNKLEDAAVCDASAPPKDAPDSSKGGEIAASTAAEGPATKKRRIKKWLDKGLYSGQEAPSDISKALNTQEKKKLALLPELQPRPRDKPNTVLPFPIFNGTRLLLAGRDFKLPYDVCNPLPPGQPKPASWRTMTKNRFVGDASAYWKKTPHFEDFASKCVCKAADGCGEDCQNRIMLYECDTTNCALGPEFCQNRAFQTLQERTKKGGRYRVGVEVYKTGDRGYGVRSNRCFEPNQIIMEYTGEIITEEECERRMNEVYKNNECYYLMSFDQNMIIDATTGSIARFVNHSCSPNCRMIKWIVAGQPRMALFAGDRPIMTGEELTYDYNFDPFSAKNVQKCLCGAPNCRGVLGPKPKEVKPPKPAKDEAGKKKGSMKGSVKAGKRKLKELLSNERDGDGKATKKRKIATATGVVTTKTITTKTAKGKSKVMAKGKGKVVAAKMATKGAAKGAATAIKRSVSKVTVKAKTALSKKTASGYVVKRGTKTTTTTSATKTQTKLSWNSSNSKAKKSVPSSPESASSTIVAAPAKSSKASPSSKKATGRGGSAKSTPASKAAGALSAAATKEASGRKRTPSRKLLESATSSAAASPASGKSKAGVDASRPSKVRLVEESVYDFPS